MPLKKVTKTIPLAGGIHEDAQEFVLQPPGMAYVENGRFLKTDSVEKTEPYEYLLAPTGLTQKIDPQVLYEDKNNNLITIKRDRSHVHDGTNWDTLETFKGSVYGAERILSTTGKSGGSCYSFAPFLKDGDSISAEVMGYCVAYEIREHGNTLPTVTIFVDRYDANGAFLDTTEIETGCSPTAQPILSATGDFCVVRYSTTSGTLKRLIVNAPHAGGPPSGAGSSDSITIRVRHQGFNGNEKWYGSGGAGLDHERLRMGFTLNAKYNAAYKYKQPYNKSYGVVAYKAPFGPSWGDLLFQTTDGAGVPSGTARFIQGDVDQTAVNSLLDVDVDDTYVYVLRAEHDTSDLSGHVTIYAGKFNKSTGAQVGTWKQVDFRPATCPQGSIAVKSNGDVKIAWTVVVGGPDQMGFYPFPYTDLNWVELDSDWTTERNNGNLSNHRLASNITINEDGDAVVVIQQFFNANPNAGNFTRNVNLYTVVPAAIKPVSSILVRLDSLNVFPLGVFDAGQSKDKDASMAEQNIHYANLYNLYIGATDDWTLFFNNRVLLTTEDYAFWHDNTTTSTDGVSDGRRSRVAGESRCAIYKTGYNIESSSSKFSGGFTYNSAVPLWHTNNVTAELSVLDQPEILCLRGRDENNNFVLFDENVGYSSAIMQDEDDWRVFQIVMGYYDASGNVHRSAPSFPVFADLRVDRDSEWRTVEIWGTTPVTFGDGKDYFMEVYMGDPGSEVFLAASTQFNPLDFGEPPAKVIFPLALAPAGGELQDIIAQSKPLYTAGNVLPADPWPVLSQVATTSRRMFALSEEAPGVVFYSKLFEENVAPEFSAPLVISTGSFRDLTAIGEIDDKIVVFEKDRVHVLYGTGPDNTGANGDFFVERLQTILGCDDPESVLTTSDGLMFYSSVSKEFHMITRDLQIVDVGAPVMDLTDDLTVEASLFYPENHEAMFFCTGTGSSDWGPDPDTGATIPERPPRPRFGRSLPSNPTLVYNFKYQKWSVISDALYGGKVASLWNNKPAYLSEFFGLHAVLPTPDWTNAEAMVLETPWIKVNQLQDYGRFYWATFVGKYLSSWADAGNGHEAGDLKVTVKYDYEGKNGATDEYLFRANVDFDPTDGERLQFRVRPGRQKCQAIKFIIEEVATTKVDAAEPDYTLGRGFELGSIDLVYGAKRGSARNFGRGRQK